MGCQSVFKIGHHRQGLSTTAQKSHAPPAGKKSKFKPWNISGQDERRYLKQVKGGQHEQTVANFCVYVCIRCIGIWTVDR